MRCSGGIKLFSNTYNNVIWKKNIDTAYYFLPAYYLVPTMKSHYSYPFPRALILAFVLEPTVVHSLYFFLLPLTAADEEVDDLLPPAASPPPPFSQSDIEVSDEVTVKKRLGYC